MSVWIYQFYLILNIFCDESKAQCTYGRGGEEINDTTRHDYVSLELNTLRVGKKMEIGVVVYKHTPLPPPSLSLSSSPSRSHVSLSHFFKDPFIVQS